MPAWTDPSLEALENLMQALAWVVGFLVCLSMIAYVALLVCEYGPWHQEEP